MSPPSEAGFIADHGIERCENFALGCIEGEIGGLPRLRRALQKLANADVLRRMLVVAAVARAGPARAAIWAAVAGTMAGRTVDFGTVGPVGTPATEVRCFHLATVC